jgi:hypothetical protein
MTDNLKKLRKAIFRLALGMLLVLWWAPATPAAADTTVQTGSFSVQLMISNVSASSIGITYTTILWETNGNADSQVFYDTAVHDNISDYSLRSLVDSTLVSHHSVYLNGLSASTSYHFRVKSVISAGSTEFITSSQDYTFTTIRNTGGSSGSGGVTATRRMTLSEVNGLNYLVTSTINTDSQGIALNSGQFSTADGKLSLKINAGTRLLDSAGEPLSSIYVTPDLSVVTPLSENAIVMVYEFGPSGANFTPQIVLTLKYDPATLPAGVIKSTLYIAYCDGSDWRALPSTVDTQARTVSAGLSHFTLFALMGHQTVPTATPVSTPAPKLTPTSAPMFTTSTTIVSSPIPAPTPGIISTPTSIPSPSATSNATGVLTNWWSKKGIFETIVFFAAIVIVALVAFFVFRRRTR